MIFSLIVFYKQFFTNKKDPLWSIKISFNFKIKSWRKRREKNSIPNRPLFTENMCLAIENMRSTAADETGTDKPDSK